jgi:YNFM family putative membrane transporter
MDRAGDGRDTVLKVLIFSLVASAFSTIYITQPVLPVLQREFGVSAARASTTVSAVILGIALANLPFGALSDRARVRPIILAGGLVVAGAGGTGIHDPRPERFPFGRGSH